MTPKQADILITAGAPVTVRSKQYQQTATLLFISRDRHSIRCANGGVYDRADLSVESINTYEGKTCPH